MDPKIWVSLITTVLVLTPSSSSAFSTRIIQLINFMDNNEEILAISGSKTLRTEMDARNLEEILPFRSVSFFSKGIPAFNTSSSYFTEYSSIRTKIIVEFETVNETLVFIDEVSNVNSDLNQAKDDWMLILWPGTFGGNITDGELQSIANVLKSPNFYTTFPVSSKLYLGFSILATNAHNLYSVNQLFVFYEVYSINAETIIRKVTQLGTTFWQPFDDGNDELECSLSETCRRSNFHEVELRVEGVEDPEFQNDTVYVYDTETNTIKLTDGFSVQVLRLAQQAFNFTYKATIMNPMMAKQLSETSAWDGVVNRVEKGEVDVGLSLTVSLPQRLQRVYLLPATDVYIVSAFFRPPSLNAIRDIFMQPFELDLWAAVVSSWLVLAFSMILFTAIRKRVGAASSDEPDFAESSLIWALATACQQGWDEHPVAGSLRAIFISGSFTGVVAYAGYSAAIVSTLSLRSDPIKNPQGLIDSSLSIGMRYGFLDNILSRNESEDVITRIYRRLSKKLEEGRVNVSAGFDILEKKEYAFVCIRDTFYDTVASMRDDKQICDIRDLQLLSHGFPGGPFLQRTSPYKEFFRELIIKIRERGVLWRLRDYYAYTRRCQTSNDNTGLALGLNDVFTAFMILLGGYALSSAFVFMEKMFYVNKLTYIQ